METITNRVFTKRETEKSDWSGRIGATELKVDGKGKWWLDGVELPQASADYLANFALQSLQDAYAGASSLDDATKRWEAKRKALLEGTVGVRSGGGGEEPHMAYVRQIVRKALGEANKAKYDAIPSDDQAARKEFLEGLYDGLDDDKREAVETEAKRQLAVDVEAKRAAKEAATGLGL